MFITITVDFYLELICNVQNNYQLLNIKVDNIFILITQGYYFCIFIIELVQNILL